MSTLDGRADTHTAKGHMEWKKELLWPSLSVISHKPLNKWLLEDCLQNANGEQTPHFLDSDIEAYMWNNLSKSTHLIIMEMRLESRLQTQSPLSSPLCF